VAASSTGRGLPVHGGADVQAARGRRAGTPLAIGAREVEAPPAEKAVREISGRDSTK
jgi:hypothetical protein